VKLRGTSSELCTLFIGSVWNSKIALARGLRTVLGYVGKRRWGLGGIGVSGSGYNEVLALEVLNVV